MPRGMQDPTETCTPENPSESVSRPVRRSYSRQQRLELLHQYERSGLSASAFAKQNGIHPTTFNHWKRKSLVDDSASASTPKGFIEVGLPSFPNTSALSLRYRDWLEIRVTQSSQVDWASRLIRQLREAQC